MSGFGSGIGRSITTPGGAEPTMSIRSRLANLEKRLGTDRTPRRIVICFGTFYRENWIECLSGEKGTGLIHFHVRIPDDDATPWAHLSDEQRAEIRHGDSVGFIEILDNGRNPHLQGDIPPWKRRPWRKIDGGRGYELQDKDGVWLRVDS
jgi:hypothetical protein